MPTLTIDVTGETREAMTKAYYGAMSRSGNSTRETKVSPALSAIGIALGGSETSVEVDTSGLRRKDLGSLVRTLDSFVQVIPNARCLVQFARAIEAADRAANPNAGRLRDAG